MSALALAQPATPAQRAGVKEDRAFGTMHFRTRLGSFKIINGRGRVEFSFKGTVMISDLKGTHTITGKTRKEFEKNGRVIYSGTGTVVVTGEWRAVQWFGKDMNAVWYGAGVVRLGGEFDQNQQTGDFWYEDPKKINYWPGSNTMDIANPSRAAGTNTDLKIKR